MKSFCRGGWLPLVILGISFKLTAVEAPLPKFTGIVRLNDRVMALLELSELSGSNVREVVLLKGDRDGIFTLVSIDVKSAKVALRRDAGEVIELQIEQAPGEELDNRTFNLRSAKLEQVLEVYQMLAGRTVIRPSALPDTRLDLKSGASLANANALAMLTRALTEKGMLAKPASDKFVFVLPIDRESELSEIPDPPRSEVGSTNEVFEPGLLKFDGVDLRQVLDIYAELTGRTVLQPQMLPSTRMSVRIQTRMTRDEAVWLLEALSSLGGVALAPESDKFVFAVPVSMRHKLPKFTAQAASVQERNIVSPGTMSFSDAELLELLKTYASLRGREPLTIDNRVAGAKFSLRTKQKLTQAESIFALEAVASLNNLRLELVGDSQVQIIPAAAARTLPR